MDGTGKFGKEGKLIEKIVSIILTAILLWKVIQFDILCSKEEKKRKELRKRIKENEKKQREQERRIKEKVRLGLIKSVPFERIWSAKEKKND